MRRHQVETYFHVATAQGKSLYRRAEDNTENLNLVVKGHDITIDSAPTLFINSALDTTDSHGTSECYEA